MRAPLWLLFVAGCAHQAAPPPTGPPAGPRLQARAGEIIRGRTRLTLETDFSAAQGSAGQARRLALAFTFVDEEHVDAVTPDGTAQITAHLSEVKAAGSEAAEQMHVEGMVRALGMIEIKFSRSARGEVTDLTLTNLQPPLEEQTARSMLMDLYAAQTGPFLPETAAETRWTFDKPMPATGSFSGGARFECSVTHHEGATLQVGCDGHIEGRGTRGTTTRRLEGRSSRTFRVDAGRLVGSVADSELTVREEILGQQTLATGIRQHVHAEWTRE